MHPKFFFSLFSFSHNLFIYLFIFIIFNFKMTSQKMSIAWHVFYFSSFYLENNYWFYLFKDFKPIIKIIIIFDK